MNVQNLFQSVQQAEALVESGELQQAADICKDMLDKHPDFPHGYYLMSSLFRATGTFNNALTFSQMAIKLEPNIAAFHIQHGQILFSMNENAAAAEAFRAAHRIEPNNPIPLLLWADAMAQQNQFDEAVRLFGRARKVRDIPEIDLHEGLCYLMKGANDKAESLFNRVIERMPEYEWGHIQKGKLLLQAKRSSEAEACFARALKCNANAYEALHGMAMVSEQQSHYDQATRYAMQAIQANPNGWESHMQLGSLLITQHQYTMAEQVLTQASALQPDNAYIMQLLIVTLIRQNKHAQALAQLDQMLVKAPDNKMLRYFQAMLRGDRVETSPTEYIVNLFDYYADRFDHHLQQVLGYKVPQLLAQMVAEMNPSKNQTLLDLGCGTGLLAEAFKDFTSQRVGVDLSSRMIAKARDRKLYNALYAQDIVEFMKGCEQRFDLVTAADVVVYIGDLAPIFKSVRAVLADSGLFMFSIEKNEHIVDYSLTSTGRYTHAPGYVEHLCLEEGYEIVQQRDITGRMENDMPVASMAYILKKRQMH